MRINGEKGNVRLLGAEEAKRFLLPGVALFPVRERG